MYLLIVFWFDHEKVSSLFASAGVLELEVLFKIFFLFYKNFHNFNFFSYVFLQVSFSDEFWSNPNQVELMTITGV